MAQFQRIMTTAKGQALIAKMMTGISTGAGNVPFTRIVTSSEIYEPEQLEGLTALDHIKQSSLISAVTRTNEATVKIEGAMNNTELTQSYRCNTIGIYAADPDDGEILYGVTIVDLTIPSNAPDFIPAFNGVTTTGITFDFLITVGNSDNVSLEVAPAAVVTVKQLNQAIDSLRNELMAEFSKNAGKHIIISETEPEEPCKMWLKPMGGISIADAISGGQTGEPIPTTINITGAHFGDEPPEDKGKMWFKPIQQS